MLQSSECHRITEPGRDSKTTTHLGSKPCAHAVAHSPEESLLAKNEVPLKESAHASEQRRRRLRVLLGAPHEMSAVARMQKPNGINIPRAQAPWAGNDRAHCMVDRVVDDMVGVVDGAGSWGLRPTPHHVQTRRPQTQSLCRPGRWASQLWHLSPSGALSAVKRGRWMHRACCCCARDQPW